jgi:hypothetical protein
VLLLDPMLGKYCSPLFRIHVILPLMYLLHLATGGSAMKAVEVLIEHGVPEERIIFINLVSYFFTAFRLDTYLESKDRLPRRTKNVLRKISYFACRKFLLVSNPGRADWLLWCSDNWVD